MAGVDIKYKGSSIATIQGTGSKTLLTEGKYCEGDILIDYVQEGITPSGTKPITTNGTHDVTNFANADVQVTPDLIIKNVIANGTYIASQEGHDGYSQVSVAVPSSFVNILHTQVSAHANTELTLISNNAFIASNYDDPNAFAMIVRLTNLDDTNGGLNFLFNSNKDFGTTTNGGSTHVYGYYGNRANNGETTASNSRVTKPLSYATSSTLTLRASSSGDLIIRPASGLQALREGQYFVIFGLMEE